MQKVKGKSKFVLKIKYQYFIRKTPKYLLIPKVFITFAIWLILYMQSRCHRYMAGESNVMEIPI